MRVYVDTSVFGGCFDKEFADSSKRLISEFVRGRKVVVISDITLRELEDAPEQVGGLLMKIPDENREYVILDKEARKLARDYIEEKVVDEGHLIDAQHIAIATVERVDVLVSWNFKHIVNLRKIQQYNGVNLKSGYSLLEIRSPEEVIYEEI